MRLPRRAQGYPVPLAPTPRSCRAPARRPASQARFPRRAVVEVAAALGVVVVRGLTVAEQGAVTEAALIARWRVM